MIGASQTAGDDATEHGDDAWELLRRVGSSQATGSLLAVVDLGNASGPARSYTYRQLWCRCASAAGFFADTPAPVCPGDRIAAMFENCPAYMEMHFVAAALRATLVNLNFRLAAPELAYILSNSEPSWLVAHVSYRSVLLDAMQHPDGGAAAASIRGFVWVGLAECTAVSPVELADLPLPECVSSACEHVYSEVVANAADDQNPDALWSAPPMVVSNALHLYYTSGTTGRPKGVVLTHKNMLCHARRCVATIGYCRDDVWGHIAPMFHLVDSQAIYFMTQVAARHVFVRGFQPDMVMQAIHEQKITTTNLASTMVAVLMSNPRRSELDLSSIRILSCGGSPLAPDVIETAIRELGCVFFMDYGMTECSGHICISLLSPELQALPLKQRLQLNSMSGLPFYGMDVRVVDPTQASDSTIAADGVAVGEVVVRGDTVFGEYWKNQPATVASRLAASDGGPSWFRTGDLAVVNAQGFVNVISRVKDMIISGGENIYATEVENAIAAHSKVTMAAVVGVPDDLLGERVKAFVTCASQALDPDELWKPLELDELCDFLSGKLADYKIPSLLEVVETFPMTTSGKIRKNVLRERSTTISSASSTKTDTAHTQHTIVLEKVVEVARAVFRCMELTSETPFVDAGMSSILALRMRERLETAIGLPLPPTVCYDYPCAQRLSDFVVSIQGSTQLSAADHDAAPDKNRVTLGIVGAAANFPGESISLHTMWACLKSGKDLNQPIPIDRFDVCEYYESREGSGGDGNTTYVLSGYFTNDGAKSFDNDFFGISAAEALQMDPQQRATLSAGYAALDDAGLTRESLLGSSTGVYVGMMSNDVTTEFKDICARTGSDWPLAFSLSGIENAVAAGRVSYCLGLRGPAVCVNTACSSSLVALDNAVMALTLGKITQAVVIGVSIMLSPFGFVATCKAGMLSPDGRCKTFDAGADGFARGEGCGAVVVKRSTDTDTLHVLLCGVGVNQDGRSAGLTAPSGPAQVEVIRAALSASNGLPAKHIRFVETHGTGTPLGDPIETGALAQVLEGSECEVILGAVKTILGHCEAAAGMAGLLKTILVLKHRKAPGNLHLQKLNPLIDFGKVKPIFPTREEELRSPAQEALCAGLSSFGFSGTNAHIVVQSATGERQRKPIRNRVAFLCTGQGSQYVRMGQHYMDAEPEFRAAMEQCDRLLSGVMDKGLLEVIYGSRTDGEIINQTKYAQPAIFALEYSLAELWRSRGVIPDMVMGHSLGEYVAACLSGQISLESALRIVAKRAELMAALPTNGTMAAVFQSEEIVRTALTNLQLGSQACIACVNGPNACVVSGSTDAVEQLTKQIGGATKVLTVSHAFHSPLMMPMITDFAAILADVEMGLCDDSKQPAEFVSNMRGAGAVVSPQHWVDHVTEPVDFLGGMKTIVAAGCRTLVELGPTPTLVKMGPRCLTLENEEKLTWVSSMEPECSSEFFPAAVAAVLDSGCHQFNKNSFPWYRDCILHPILHRTIRETNTAAGRATGICGDHVSGSVSKSTMHSLHQHRINGTAVMPAAAILDSVATAIQHVHATTVVVTLFDVVFKEALSLKEDSRVRVSLEESQVSFSSHAYGHDAKELVHMTSTFETSSLGQAEENVGTLLTGLAKTDVDKFYAQAGETGLVYGDDFKGITELWVVDPKASISESHGIVVGKLRSRCLSNAWQQCSWDPTVLDALFQLNIALSQREALIPFTIGRMDFLAQIQSVKSDVLYGRARLTYASPGVQVTDLTLMDASGIVIISVHGFETRKPTVERLLRGCTWSVTWEAPGEALQNQKEAKVETATPQSGPLLFCSQGSADASRFSDHSCTFDLKIADAELLLRGWAVCVVIVDACEAAHESALLDIMQLLRLANEISFSSPMWIVTEGAQHSGRANAAPKLAGVWGLVRTARIEMPHLRLGCLDLSPRTSAELCRWQIRQDPLVEPEVSICDEGDDSVRRVPRLKALDIQVNNKVDFDAERTYLVTGGLRGFGLRTAIWMCERGARHLALLSRSGAVRESDSAGLADWERLQSLPEVDLCTISCDISDPAAVANALQEIDSNGMPPLGGVIHAAGVLSDAMLEQQTADTVRAVYAPKVDGVYNLHEATANCDPPLNFFVVFSSVAGVLGSAAQANYAAANCCVDAFVAWRRSKGLPACSLAWGPLAEVGMAARNGTAKRVQTQGLGEVPVATAFEALELGLSTGAPPCILVVPAKWPRWIAQHPSYEPFLRLVAPVQRAPTEALATKLRHPEVSEQGRAAPQPARVYTEVVSLIETLIGPAGASQLHDQAVLLDCGLDSLGTMELRQGLSRRFDITLPPNFLDLHPTLKELVTTIQHSIGEVTSSNSSMQLPAASAPVPPQSMSARQLCHLWDASIGPEVALSAADFFGGIAPVLLGPQSTAAQLPVQITIVVIGWAGSSPQALSPIVAWHRGQGFHVLQLIPALGGDLDADCYAALDALGQDPEVLAGRCVLHCFSNNSIFFLRRMLSSRPQPFERPRLLPLRGLIIDSAPHACEDVSAVERSGPVALQAHLAASLGFVTDNHEGVDHFGLLEAVADAHWKRRRSQVLSSAVGSVVLPSGTPRLYIYGSIDNVVQSAVVKGWIDQERRLGEQVEAVELQSGHVEHHLVHTTKYWEIVSRFIARC